MNKNIISVLLASMFCSAAIAEKIYMGIFVTNSEYAEWVSLRDKPCGASDENAVMMSGSSKKNGCWKLDDKKIKIEWIGDAEPSDYPLENFKLISDTKFNTKKRFSERCCRKNHKT